MGYILGIDEAGRGAWAGPLVVGAVILDGDPIWGLTDSKLLSRLQRQRLSEIIRANSIFCGLGWVSSAEIDRLGLTAATRLAIERAISGLEAHDVEIIIDGHINYLDQRSDSRAMVKADLNVPAVSAASIIAKTTRDEYMARLGQDFPLYGFDSHVGYGTSRHLENLKKYGRCAEHRVSFKPVSVFA